MKKNKARIKIKTDLEKFQETYAEFDKDKMPEDKWNEVVKMEEEHKNSLPGRIMNSKRIQNKWEKK